MKAMKQIAHIAIGIVLYCCVAARGQDELQGVFSNEAEEFKTATLMVHESGNATFHAAAAGVIGKWSYDKPSTTLTLDDGDPGSNKDSSIRFTFDAKNRTYTLLGDETEARVDSSRTLHYVTAPSLRLTLEAVYARYLQAIETEDAKLLLAVLPAARMTDLKRTFAVNGMTFPDDYFSIFKKFSPNMPPTAKLRFIGITESEGLANLVYIGDMNGYLRKTTSEKRFLIIQFEKESSGWKYGAITDPPLQLVPDLKAQLSAGVLDFLKNKPFSAEKIELRP